MAVTQGAHTQDKTKAMNKERYLFKLGTEGTSHDVLLHLLPASPQGMLVSLTHPERSLGRARSAHLRDPGPHV
jgi:hypothetical protein